MIQRFKKTFLVLLQVFFFDLEQQGAAVETGKQTVAHLGPLTMRQNCIHMKKNIKTVISVKQKQWDQQPANTYYASLKHKFYLYFQIRSFHVQH